MSGKDRFHPTDETRHICRPNDDKVKNSASVHRGDIDEISREQSQSDPIFARNLNLYDRLLLDRLHYHYGCILLRSVLEKVELDFSERATFAGIALTVAKPVVYVGGDPLLLYDCIAILVDNAIKHSQSRKIQIEVRTVKASAPRVLIVVRDDGGGLSESQLMTLDQPESVYGKPKDFKPKLGMKILKAICARLGYRTSIRAPLGEGTEATLMLPRIPSHFVADAGSRSERNNEQIVLLVGDKFSSVPPELVTWTNSKGLRLAKVSTFERMSKYSKSVAGYAALMFVSPEITDQPDHVTQIDKLRDDLNQRDLMVISILPPINMENYLAVEGGRRIVSLLEPIDQSSYVERMDLLLKPNFQM